MSEPLLAAGIDGGASRTRAVLVTAEGRIAGFGTAGPSNYDNVGEDAAADNLRDAVLAARREAGTGPVSSMFLGLAGVVSSADRETVRRMAVRHGLAPEGAIGVDHDIRIALAGGLEGREGIVLIAGTGSSTYGRRADGRSHRTGWGFLLDDRGSGYFLGLQAMIATVMEADGRGAPTGLSALVRARFGFSDIDEILRIVYHDRIPVAAIASLAPDVIRLAGKGDAAAEAACATGAEELARMAGTVAERIGFGVEEFPLTMTGGLVDRPGYYRGKIESAIRRCLPRARVVPPSLPPVIGAALLALDAAGVPRTEPLLAALKEQARLLAPEGAPGPEPGE